MPLPVQACRHCSLGKTLDIWCGPLFCIAHAYAKATFFSFVGARTSSTEIHDTVVIEIESTDTVTPRPPVAGPIATDAEFAALLGRPIQLPEGPRPFTRTSTVTELSASPLGRMLAALMRRQMDKMIPDDDDGSLRELMEDVVVSIPLRGLAAMGPGLTPSMLDRIVAALNGHWIRAIRGK